MRKGAIARLLWVCGTWPWQRPWSRESVLCRYSPSSPRSDCLFCGGSTALTIGWRHGQVVRRCQRSSAVRRGSVGRTGWTREAVVSRECAETGRFEEGGYVVRLRLGRDLYSIPDGYSVYVSQQRSAYPTPGKEQKESKRKIDSMRGIRGCLLK